VAVATLALRLAEASGVPNSPPGARGQEPLSASAFLISLGQRLATMNLYADGIRRASACSTPRSSACGRASDGR
jgi:hypothetical protein